MKSTTGQYYLSLDHIRAFAVFLVFVWHYNHFRDGQIQNPLVFPLSILTEGHTGVAIFMTLSGYLFAKLIGNSEIKWRNFFWNRLIRLAPLLIFMMIIFGSRLHLHGISLESYLTSLIEGFIQPRWPNGGWSITVELHFYLILPILIWGKRKSQAVLWIVLLSFLLLRLYLYYKLGSVQGYSYSTIVGRSDQFILGILAFHNKSTLKRMRKLLPPIFLIFLAFWYLFDKAGGFYSEQTTSIIWVFIPTIEGAAYAALVSWYDNFSRVPSGKVGKFLANIGKYSYSIYLLQFFIVFQMPVYIDKYLINLDNPYFVILSSIPSFLIMVFISFITYHCIELPFLKFRKNYIRNTARPSSPNLPI